MPSSSDLLIAKALVRTGCTDVIRLAQSGALTATEALELAAPQWFTDEWKRRMPPDWTIRDYGEFGAHQGRADPA